MTHVDRNQLDSLYHLKSYKSKNVLFRNKHLYWIEQLKEEGKDCIHVGHNQLDLRWYTNIVSLWLHRHSVILKPAQYWCRQF